MRAFGDWGFLAVFAFAPSAALAVSPNLLSNGSFESGASGWTLTGPAVVQSADWAASAGANGVWLQGFTAGDAAVSQSVVAPTDGDYVLLFDARKEENFSLAASSFGVSLDGPGGGVAEDLFAKSNSTFVAHALTLPGVSAGQTLTVGASSTHAGGSGPQRSAFVDNFYLGAATNMRSMPLFDGERLNFNSPALINNWGGKLTTGSTSGLSLDTTVKRSGEAAYRLDLGPTGAGQARFLQAFAAEEMPSGQRSTRDLAYFDAFETYVRNDTGADLTLTLDLRDYRNTSTQAARRQFNVPAGSTWTKISAPLDLSTGWTVSGAPQLDQTYSVSLFVQPSQATSGAVYFDDARLIEPGAALNPLTAPIGQVAEALARRTFQSLWGQRSRQSGYVPNTSTTAQLGALNATSGLVWALPSAVRRGWVAQGDADAYMSLLSDSINHTRDQTTYLPSRFVDLVTGDAHPEESTIDAAFLAMGLQLYRNQPGLDPTLATKIEQTVERFNFAAFAFGNGWGFGYDRDDGVSGGRYTGYTTEGKTISLAAELSSDHHVDLEQLWNSDTFRTKDYLQNPDLAALVYFNDDFRAPFEQALVNLFVDLSDRGIDDYPTPSLRGNPWDNFKNFEEDSGEYLAAIGRPYFFQPDAGQGGPPSDYKAYSLYNLYPSGGETNEDLLMPWSATLALLSGAPDAEMALRFLLQNDLQGPLGMADAARWDTGADAPSAVNAMQDNWNLSLSLMALMRYIDGLDGGARFLADLPQVDDALDHLYSTRLAGDYDNDGDVDQRDFTLWQRALGGADLAADGNGDRIVDGSDFLVWQRARAAAVAASAAVPELPGLGLATLGAAAALAARLGLRDFR